MKNDLITNKEWRWVFWMGAIILLLSSLPYIAGYLAENEEFIFSGAAFNLPDYSVHLSTIQQGFQGEWRYRFIFTNEVQAGAYLKLFYIGVGQAARILGISAPVAYQAARVVFGIIACFAIYWLIALTLPGVKLRQVIFLIAILGSGLGWFQWLFNLVPFPNMIDPIDFWMSDGYVFYSMAVFPHYSVVLTLQIAIVAGYLHYISNQDNRILVGLAVAGLILQFIQPFAPFIPYLIVLVLFFVEFAQKKEFDGRTFWRLGMVAAVQVPLLYYNYFVFQSEYNFASFAEQGMMISPPFVYYLWGYGLLWPLVIWGLSRRQMLRSLPVVVAATWVLGALAAAHWPFQFQRRFMFGFSLPIALLFGAALHQHVIPWFNRQATWIARRKVSLAILVFPFMILSTLYLSLGRGYVLLNQPEDVFSPAALVEAVEWLGENSDSADVVMGAERTGQWVGARIGRTAYIGHLWETAEYELKSEQVRGVYQGIVNLSDLGGRPINWVIYGPYEQEIAPNFLPDIGWDMVYDEDGVKIFNTR